MSANTKYLTMKDKYFYARQKSPAIKKMISKCSCGKKNEVKGYSAAELNNILKKVEEEIKKRHKFLKMFDILDIDDIFMENMKDAK